MENKNDDLPDFVYNNEEESEMGQVQAIHNNMNAIAEVQRKLQAQAKLPSNMFCDECGDEIPKARRKLVPGVKLCITCQTNQETFYKGK